MVLMVSSGAPGARRVHEVAFLATNCPVNRVHEMVHEGTPRGELPLIVIPSQFFHSQGAD